MSSKSRLPRLIKGPRLSGPLNESRQTWFSMCRFWVLKTLNTHVENAIACCKLPKVERVDQATKKPIWQLETSKIHMPTETVKCAGLAMGEWCCDPQSGRLESDIAKMQIRAPKYVTPTMGFDLTVRIIFGNYTNHSHEKIRNYISRFFVEKTNYTYRFARSASRRTKLFQLRSRFAYADFVAGAAKDQEHAHRS